MKRTFFAIPIVAKECCLLQKAVKLIAQQLGDEIHWIPEKKWHVTVRFLGNVNEYTIDYLARIAEQASCQVKKFLININKIGEFPSSYARTIAAHVGANDSLNFLFNALNNAALKVGVPHEDRTYKPHITLAKFDNYVRHFEPVLFEKFTLHAQELVLFHSKLIGHGSDYIPLKIFPFDKC